MKLVSALVAASVTLSALAVPAAAQPPGPGGPGARGWHGPHPGWNNRRWRWRHHRRCHWVWRHHRRVRVCW